MSVKVSSAVWESSRHKGSALLVLLAIADYAHPDGSNAFPSLVTLARKTRLSPRQVRRIIHEKLVPSGELSVEERPGTSNTMTVVVPDDSTPVARDLLRDSMMRSEDDRGGRSPATLPLVVRDLPPRSPTTSITVAYPSGQPSTQPSSSEEAGFARNLRNSHEGYGGPPMREEGRYARAEGTPTLSPVTTCIDPSHWFVVGSPGSNLLSGRAVLAWWSAVANVAARTGVCVPDFWRAAVVDVLEAA